MIGYTYSQLLLCQTLICFIEEYILGIFPVVFFLFVYFFVFFLHFNSLYLRLQVSQNKFSGLRKFILIYQ